MTRPRVQCRQSSRTPHGTITVSTVPTKAEPAPMAKYMAAGGRSGARRKAARATPAQNQKATIASKRGDMPGSIAHV
jgi:hypothetical protein